MIALLLPLAAALAATTAPYDHTHAALDALLKAHVADGLVDYAGLKGDRAPLDTYLATAGAVPVAEFQQWSKDEQLAFLINVYNAATLQLIIDAYPVDSIKSLGNLIKSPWSRETVMLFGKKVSLDTVEHGMIRKNYAEPRIHFALVCAALGCPPLRDEAYQAARLAEQLDAQAKAFLNDPSKNRVDMEKQVVWLSPIFKWYGDDFTSGGGTLLSYVAPHMGLDAPSAYSIKYTNYDWSLNVQGASR